MPMVTPMQSAATLAAIQREKINRRYVQLEALAAELAVFEERAEAIRLRIGGIAAELTDLGEPMRKAAEVTGMSETWCRKQANSWKDRHESS
jgi:hypothetical protein